jgi:hypothetical protein
MTHLPERLLCLCRATLAGLILALLASCGPGTGGTGTGPDISFSSPATSSAAAIAAPAMPGCVACTRADLHLQEGRIELVVPCGRFLFLGQWTADAAQLTLAGSFEPRGGSAVPATLQLQFNAPALRSDQVTASVVEPSGSPLVAAQALLRREQAPGPEVCRP